VVAGTLNPQFPHPVTKGVGMQIENSSRTSWSLNDSTCLTEGGQDMVSLHFLQSEET